MSSRLSHYANLEPLRSFLVRNPPETVPPTDELESLKSELEILKKKTLERAKKADEDLRIIAESLKRMKEREKGKARAIEKVKREPDCAYIPEYASLHLHVETHDPSVICRSRFPISGPPHSKLKI